MAGSPYAFLNSAVAIALTTARQLPFPTVEVVKCIIAEILEGYTGAVLVLWPTIVTSLKQMLKKIIWYINAGIRGYNNW